MTDERASDPQHELDDRAPVLGSWRNIYVLVLGSLVVVIVLFTLLTERYS